jgi:hypothetical protein
VCRDRRDSLGRRVDVRERLAFPRLAARFVPEARPEVDDRLAFEREAERRSELVAVRELLRERVPDGLELGVDAALDLVRHGVSSGSANAT